MSPTHRAFIKGRGAIIAGGSKHGDLVPPAKQTMQRFQDVLDGKLKVSDLTPEELPEFVKFGKTEGEKVLGETTGIRGARQAEEIKLGDLKTKVEEAQGIIAEAEKLNKPTLSPEMQTFRQEQVEKAKERLFATVQLDDAQRAAVLEKFKSLDSGKLDADFIYRDLLSAAAAAHPELFAEMLTDKQRRERAAAEQLARETEANGGKPPEDKNKKWPPEVTKLAQEAGITPEQAHRQLTEGTHRVLG